MPRTRLLLALIIFAWLGSSVHATPRSQRDTSPAQYVDDAADTVEVLWGGTWWAATVINQRPERHARFYKIHYTGWSASYDEWVEADRVRTPAAQTAARTQGPKVEILWGGRWWAGRILERAPRAALVRISSDGCGSEWHQWVERDRVRPSSG